MSTSITITTKTILKTVLILLIIGFILIIKDVLALFFIALILSSAFDPLIDWLQNKKIPRSLSIIGVYFVFFVIVGGAIYLLAGPLIAQIKDMSRAFPDFYTKINHSLQSLGKVEGIPTTNTVANSVTSSLADITKGLTQATSSIFNALTSIFGGIISFFMVLVLTFYLTVEENLIKNFVNGLIPDKHRNFAAKLVKDIQHRMGSWLRGQLILSVIIFALVYLGLSLLGIKYALILALVAGIFEIVPFLGPILSAIPAIFFAFDQGLTMAIIVAILYFVIQQLENNLIVPKVMGRSTGLNPLIVLLAILIGARLGGVIGALLAVPLATGVAVYIEHVIAKKVK